MGLHGLGLALGRRIAVHIGLASGAKPRPPATWDDTTTWNDNLAWSDAA